MCSSGQVLEHFSKYTVAHVQRATADVGKTGGCGVWHFLQACSLEKDCRAHTQVTMKQLTNHDQLASRDRVGMLV